MHYCPPRLVVSSFSVWGGFWFHFSPMPMSTLIRSMEPQQKGNNLHLRLLYSQTRGKECKAITEQVCSINSIIIAFLNENPRWEQCNCLKVCG